MKLSSLTSVFTNKKHKTLELPESLLVKKLKSLSKDHNLLIFENITLYHHANNYFIPLLILEEKQGILLFEYKGWSYDDLKNAKAQKAVQQAASSNTLAFEKSHDFIKRKFNELLHHDGIPISNYLLMENLNEDQYQHLDSSFHDLLPQNKVLFNDSSEASIAEKIIHSNDTSTHSYDISHTMATLLIQYAIMDHEKNIFLASEEQRAFINAPHSPLSILQGKAGSGKTASLLLKAILEKLKYPKLKVVLIKATNLACDLLKKRLLDTVEHAIIEIDLTSIEILTPTQYLKSSVGYQLILCDDTWTYTDTFLSRIRNMQNKAQVVLVSTIANEGESYFSFTRNFKNQDKEVFFHQANPYAKSLQIISTLLVNVQAHEILVVGNQSHLDNLQEDLEEYIQDETTIIDENKGLSEHNLDNLLLANYDALCSMDVNYVILMDMENVSTKIRDYALHLPKKHLYILYEEDSTSIHDIRNSIENN